MDTIGPAMVAPQPIVPLTPAAYHQLPNDTVSGAAMVATLNLGGSSSSKPTKMGCRGELRRYQKILPHLLQKRQLMKALAPKYWL